MPFHRRIAPIVLLLVLSALSLSAQDFSSAGERELAELLTPVIRLEHHLMSLDYFGQFTRGDTIFEDYLYRIFRLDQGNYEAGDGALLEVRFGGEGMLSFAQALLGTADDGSRTWRIVIAGGVYDIEYEVDVIPPGIPLRVRYRDPGSGEYYARSTMIGDEYLRVVDDLGEETIAAQVLQERNTDLRDSLRSGYAGAHRGGSAAVEGPEGEIEAELVRNQFEGGGEILYAVSGEVPGGLVSIRTPADEGYRDLARLVSISTGNRSRIGETLLSANPGSDPVPTERSSQGSIEAPVRLELGEYLDGMVASGGVSYYSFEAPFASRYVVEVSGAEGLCELVDYGSDASYWSWRGSSSDEVMSIAFTAPEAGGTFYFTVEDIVEGYTAGEEYYIGVREE